MLAICFVLHLCLRMCVWEKETEMTATTPWHPTYLFCSRSFTFYHIVAEQGPWQILYVWECGVLVIQHIPKKDKLRPEHLEKSD